MASLPADYKQTEEKSFKGTESGRDALESNERYTAKTTVQKKEEGTPTPPPTKIKKTKICK